MVLFILDFMEEQLPGRIKATWIAPLFDLIVEFGKGEKIWQACL